MAGGTNANNNSGSGASTGSATSGSGGAAANSGINALVNALVNAGSSSSSGSSSSVPANAIIPSSASESAYELWSYVFSSGKTVVLGSMYGSLLGLSGTTPVKISQVYAKVTEMSQGEALTLMDNLNNAGVLHSSDGQQIDLGNPNDPNFMASFLAALITTSDAQQKDKSITFSTYVANLQSSGAGVQSTQQTPQAQVGGGNVYELDLTNSADTQAALQSAFMSALGYMPSEQQISAFTQQFNQEQSKYQQQQNYDQEQQSVNKYNAQVTSSGISAQTQQKTSLGNVPDNISSPASYAVALLNYLNGQGGKGNIPVNASNVAAITGIINALGLWGNGHYNPLGSVYGVNGSSPVSATNPQMIYQNWAMSIQATAEALLSPQYQDVIAALETGNGTESLNSPTVKSEIARFTNGALSDSTNLQKDATQAHGAANHAINNANGVGSGHKSQKAGQGGRDGGLSGSGGGDGKAQGQGTTNTPTSLLNGHYNAQGVWVPASGTGVTAGGLGGPGNAVNNARAGRDPGGPSANNDAQSPVTPTSTPTRPDSRDPGGPSANNEIGDISRPNTNAGQQTRIPNEPSGAAPGATTTNADPQNPADIYQPATTQTNVEPASVANAATTFAMQANPTGYVAYQALQAYNVIMDLINNRGTSPVVQGQVSA